MVRHVTALAPHGTMPVVIAKAHLAPRSVDGNLSSCCKQASASSRRLEAARLAKGGPAVRDNCLWTFCGSCNLIAVNHHIRDLYLAVLPHGEPPAAGPLVDVGAQSQGLCRSRCERANANLAMTVIVISNRDDEVAATEISELKAFPAIHACWHLFGRTPIDALA